MKSLANKFMQWLTEWVSAHPGQRASLLLPAGPIVYLHESAQWNTDHYGVSVVGTTYHKRAIARMWRRLGSPFIDCKAVAELFFDDHNPHDDHAVGVVVADEHIGFLPRNLAREVRTRVRGQFDALPRLACNAWIRGKHHLGIRLAFQPDLGLREGLPLESPAQWPQVRDMIGVALNYEYGRPNANGSAGVVMESYYGRTRIFTQGHQYVHLHICQIDDEQIGPPLPDLNRYCEFLVINTPEEQLNDAKYRLR